MVEFPFEAQESIAAKHSLAAEFALAGRILRFWVEWPKAKWLSKSKLDSDVVGLAMMLNAQACRQFRTVIEECGRCEAFCANIVSRGLFETVLANCFILLKTIHIAVAPVLDHEGNQKVAQDGALKFCAKVTSKKTRRSRTTRLSRKFRAELYRANMIFSQQARFKKYKSIHGLKGIAKRLDQRSRPTDVIASEKAIGPDWSYVIRDAKTFSGLTVADLAKLIHPKMFRWYLTIYSLQSGMAHGAAALMHLRAIDEGTITAAFLSDDNEIRAVMQCATQLFLIFMAIMVDEIGFGAGANMAHREFQLEANRLYGRKPKK